ncbi:hypothetical protein [Sphingopyxis sp. GC21]|uniref:hypothetical protein n=1 Tax=Sphingopyxis sp. GC21 TaxID=2933562 RepID=UPI0021E47540|nr:hypothetical protein [Sphingopyxis sp. GC21]
MMMPMNVRRYGERSRYRIGSAALVAITGVALASANIGIPAWFIFLVAVVAGIALTIMSYHRLRDAKLSTAWLLLMILQFGMGSTLHVSDHVAFNIGGSIINWVPVIFGWIVPREADQKIELESA